MLMGIVQYDAVNKRYCREAVYRWQLC